LEFLDGLFKSSSFRYFIIIIGIHLVIGMFGLGCCGKKNKKNTKENGVEDKNKSCH
jgi:hypothetical protein